MSTDYNVWAWDASATPLNNANADGQINWTEGQDPATVNNSARAMMTAFARYLDATSGGGGAFAVGGTADAITITTGQSISSGHQALGFRLCFKAASTNTGAATVAIDGLSAVAIKRPNNDALSAGDIVSGAFHDIAFDGTNYRLFVPGAGGNYGSLSGGNTWTGSNAFAGNLALGDDAADDVSIKGQPVSVFGSQMLTQSSASAWRVNLGLGTAATYPVGTAGYTVPLLNGTNNWSETNVFSQNGAYSAIFGTSNPSTIPVQVQNIGGALFTSVYLAQFVNSGGHCGSITTIQPGSQVYYNETSDYRLKDNIRDLDGVGAVIDAIQPRRFNWKNAPGRDFTGFVAHEVQGILPEAVTGDKDAVKDGKIEPQSVAPSKLIPYLVAEIKALRARVAALEAAS